MAEIEMTLPTVQYGNVKVRLNPEELGADPGDAAAVGAATAVYLNLFTQGWKQGAALDVVADVKVEGPPGDPKAAADRVAAGEKPRTVDEANEMAKQVIENELGPTTEVESTDTETPPWEAPAVDAKVKPWETGVTAPAVLDAAW
jgi:hypothetical protein